MTTQQTQMNDLIVTSHELTENGPVMRQNFGDEKVELLYDRTAHVAGVVINGDIKDTHKNLTVSEYEAFQLSAFMVWLQLNN